MLCLAAIDGDLDARRNRRLHVGIDAAAMDRHSGGGLAAMVVSHMGSRVWLKSGAACLWAPTNAKLNSGGQFAIASACQETAGHHRRQMAGSREPRQRQEADLRVAGFLAAKVSSLARRWRLGVGQIQSLIKCSFPAP